MAHHLALFLVERGDGNDPQLGALIERVVALEIRLRNRERNVPKVIANRLWREKRKLKLVVGGNGE